MSRPHILIHTPYGDDHIRLDTADKLGIRPGDTLTLAQWDAALMEDYQANRADRRAR
jgi:hypothetical protein